MASTAGLNIVSSTTPLVELFFRDIPRFAVAGRVVVFLVGEATRWNETLVTVRQRAFLFGRDR
jgi:hypothetical protein